MVEVGGGADRGGLDGAGLVRGDGDDRAQGQALREDGAQSRRDDPVAGADVGVDAGEGQEQVAGPVALADADARGALLGAGRAGRTTSAPAELPASVSRRTLQRAGGDVQHLADQRAVGGQHDLLGPDAVAARPG